MTKEAKIEFSGGPNQTPLLTVGERNITVNLYSPKRPEMEALARVLDYVTSRMGEQEAASPQLVRLLLLENRPTTDCLCSGKEACHVAAN